MRILIISERFYPQNAIGALRPTKIAGKLYNEGYDVDVYTMYYVSREDITEHKLCSNVYATKCYQPSKQEAASNRKHGFVYKALHRAYFNLASIVHARRYCKSFAYQLENNAELSQKEYDVVFSSFGPLSSLLCGLYYKKAHPKTKWICDFRDPVVVKYVSPVFRSYYAYLQKKACKSADAIVAVSNGYLERICNGKYAEKAHMIPNGYDIEDFAASVGAVPLNEKLNITYAGSLYGGDRDLSVLFKAIKELVAENAIDPERISVNYAGREFLTLRGQAEKYGMQSVVHDYGMLSRADCLKFQFSSDMLLLATWNDKKEYGVFPGKMLEYMLIGKPIISLTSGEKPNSEITCVIREGNFGIAYETANDHEDYLKLKEYIKASYDSYVSERKVPFSPKAEVMNRYHYENIIKQIEELING